MDIKNWKILLKVVILGTLFVLSTALLAQTSVLPVGSGGNGSLIQSNAPTGLPGRITVTANCYGTNNRSTSNPISPNGIIYLHILVAEQDKGFIVKFPGALTKGAGSSMTDYSSQCGVFSGTADQINAKTPESYTYDSVDCSDNSVIADAQGFMFASDGSEVAISAFSYQAFAGGAVGARSFYGSTGVMGAGTKHQNLSYDISRTDAGGVSAAISVSASYPGQDGFCGGYHSPLMLFFSSARPEFTGKTKILRAKRGGGATYWVEKGHTGYFLALIDRKNESKGIYRANQLFGDEQYFQNGFSALAMHDTNGDNVIDSRDKSWKDLVLWKDKDGNSRSSKGELHSLESLGVVKIDLRYDTNYKKLYAERASALGKSSFSYKKGKEMATGVVTDIFFKEREK
jgi:hypothetical protein